MKEKYSWLKLILTRHPKDLFNPENILVLDVAQEHVSEQLKE